MTKTEADKLLMELKNSCNYCIDGKCSNCHGFGFTIFTSIRYPELKTRVECSICNGTGKCPHCGGSGRVR